MIILKLKLNLSLKIYAKLTSDTVDIKINDFSKLHNAIKVRVLRKSNKI